MGFLVVLVLSFAVAFGLQLAFRRRSLSVAIPVVLFVGFILLDAYVLPYRGGGASMWPVAVMLGTPVVLVGAMLGAILPSRFVSSAKGNGNAL
jgi:hypothetical protein